MASPEANGRVPRSSRRRRLYLALLSLGLALVLGRPPLHVAIALWNDRDEVAPIPAGKANDASRLDETAVAEVWKIPEDAEAAERQLAALLAHARASRLGVSIAGARHSMGGHTICPDGIVIDMLPFDGMSLDATGRILHVQAGARWRAVLEFLNARGLSVLVMQSNDDFTVGGSLSVNCHGWQVGSPPIASTVESLRLMRADGVIVRCSREENRELFSLVLGGYGLFGVILDADLRVVPNERLQLERIDVSCADYARVFAERVGGASGVAMAYGRLRVAADGLLEDAVLNVFHRAPSIDALVSELGPPPHAALARAIFRGEVGDDYGKRLRWDAERYLSPALLGDDFERNAILHEASALYADRSARTTDVLVECFVPPDRLESFVSDLRAIVPRSGADLLNVTLREVERDDDSFLRYADRAMASVVMLFSQARDETGEAKMIALTRETIAAALRQGGRYYLPYRLHASAEQFEAAYPQARRFFEQERAYDPDEIFRNELYLKYR